jgi:hypothetical protein
MEGEEGWVGGLSLTEPGDEVETRGGERHDTGVLGRVATREGIDHSAPACTPR